MYVTLHALCCSAMEQRIASGRRDLFRTRKQNTSRPPSMHVDDFMAKVIALYVAQKLLSKYLKMHKSLQSRVSKVMNRGSHLPGGHVPFMPQPGVPFMPPWGVGDGWGALCPLLDSATSEGWGEFVRGILVCLTPSSPLA